MKDETFDWLWLQIVETAKDIAERLAPIDRERQHFRLTYGNQGKHIIKQEYNTIRSNLKKRCYSKQTDRESHKNLIDHHKIAACFCAALVRKKLFAFDLNENVTAEMLRSNYELAYAFSLRIIYLYMIYGYKVSGQDDLVQKLLKNKTLYVPATTPSHDDYNLGRIKTLALNDYDGIEFNLLAYSDMMYWIEHYNRQILTGRIQLENDDWFPSDA